MLLASLRASSRVSRIAREFTPAVALLAGLSSLALPLVVAAAPQVKTPGFYIETIGNSIEDVRQDPFTPERYFSGIFKGTAFAFARQVDTVFVAEKDGRVRVIVGGEMQLRPVVDMHEQVATDIDRGIGGIDVHPDFPTIKEIIITYTHENGITDQQGVKYAKVARLPLREEVNAQGGVDYVADAPTDANVILGKLSATAEFPSCNDRPLGADCGAVDFGSHSFTFVRYGPDGKIYVGTGDGAGFYAPDPKAFYAQRLEHLSGKILRINRDGTGPSDNPFYTGNPNDNASKVYAYGLRNPKSGSFHPETGKFCVGNVGWYLNEGIYCLDAGDNAGWPCRENGPARNGYETRSLSRDGVRLASCPLQPGTWVEPDYAYPHQPSIIGGEELFLGAVIGCAIADSSEYPADFNGSCVSGDYVFDTLSSVRLGGSGNPSQVVQIANAGQPTDVGTDRNGNVCYIAYETGIADGIPVSEIRCLRYDAGGNVQRYPVPSFTTAPDPSSPLGITFNASTSYHTGGKALSYRWNFGDGTTGTGVATTHEYLTHGDYTVTLVAQGVGETLSRSTSQFVRITDPDFFTPVLPVVEGIEFATDEHFVSSTVEFGVQLRNDRGNEAFHVLTNIYDEAGTEIAHLVESELVQIDEGSTLTVPFVWEATGGAGEYRMSIEFYASDWGSWTLKYPSVATFVVRNRVSSGIDQGDGQQTTTDPTPTPTPTPGTDEGEGTPVAGVSDDESAGSGSSSSGGFGAIGGATSIVLLLAGSLRAAGALRRRRRRSSGEVGGEAGDQSSR